MNAQREVPSTISVRQEPLRRLSPEASSTFKHQQDPPRRKSFFATPQGLDAALKKARSKSTKSNAPTNHGATKGTPTATKTTTTTKTQIIDGQRVTETTTTTIMEPTKYKGLRGKLMKKIGPSKKMTHQVVTRERLPPTAVSATTNMTDNQALQLQRKAVIKKQRGIQRVATPAPVPHGGFAESFFARDTPWSTPVPAQDKSSSLAEGATLATETQTEDGVFESTPKPASVLATTVVPMQSPKVEPTYLVDPQGPEPESRATENAAREVPAEASTEQDRETAELKAPSLSTQDANYVPLPVPTRPPLRTTQPSTPAARGVPTMFAHAFVSKKTPKRTNVPKRTSEGLKAASGGPVSATSKLPVATQGKSSGPFPPTTEFQTEFQPPAAPPALKAHALKNQRPFKSSFVATTAPAKTSRNIEHNENNPDNQSEYEEITILDDEIYEITYFEEETVLDDSQHNREFEQFVSSPSSSPNQASSVSRDQVQVEGMELLMANIKNTVPKVD